MVSSEKDPNSRFLSVDRSDQSNESSIKSPPKTFFGTLFCLGTSMILLASIVGSGELIMTTTLGAQAGFVALWIIIVSCLVKVCNCRWCICGCEGSWMIMHLAPPGATES